MNMNKALQNLYHAVSGSTTTKVNISKLLVDIHYAITGVESSVKNNWSRIIDSMATNWPEGGGVTIEALTVTENDIYTAPEGKAYSPVTVNVSGGSSDFSTATVTIVNGPSEGLINGAFTGDFEYYQIEDGMICFQNLNGGTQTLDPLVLYKGKAVISSDNPASSVSGDIEILSPEWKNEFLVTGDCTITF